MCYTLFVTHLGTALRDKRGTSSLRQTAKALGISHVTLLQLERGTKRPGLEMGLRLARWLGWTAEQVLEAGQGG